MTDRKWVLGPAAILGDEHLLTANWSVYSSQGKCP
jgi:hypothetical protein